MAETAFKTHSFRIRQVSDSEDKIFFVTSSRKFLWFDEETGGTQGAETGRFSMLGDKRYKASFVTEISSRFVSIRIYLNPKKVTTADAV